MTTPTNTPGPAPLGTSASTSTSTGGTVLLTGPTGALGREVLGLLARGRPEHLVLLGRSPQALAGSARSAREAGARQVSTVQVDLADLDSVARAGQDVTALVAGGAPPLSTLLLTAGLQMTDRRHTSAQGLETTFAVNVAAQHLLLASTTAATGPGAHTVLVGSGTHYGDWHSYGTVPAPVWQDPAALARPDGPDVPADPQAGSRAYATSKLALLHLAHAWQAEHGDRRFTVYDPQLMPGTGLGRELGGVQAWVWFRAMPHLTFLPGWSTPRRSARHLVALAVGQAHPGLVGGYVEIAKERRSSAASYDLDAQRELWQWLQETSAPYATPAR